MKTEKLIEQLETRLHKYYFISLKRSDCDTEIIALSKSINDIRMSFLYDENNKMIYHISCITIGFNELLELVDTIKELLGE